MKRFALRAFASVALIASGVFVQAETRNSSLTQYSSIEDSYRASQSGAFSYAIPFDVPEFRGLVPKLGLSYNSGRTSRGHSMDVAGVGWKLSGFSEIERVSQKLGTPTFRDADDIYILDGQPLVVCDDGATYPSRFKADHQSASCLAGGNYSTLRESDRKIVKSGDGKSWTVYSKDGTRYIYRRMYELNGGSHSATSGEGKYLRSKWLLHEIVDTQPQQNKVTFEYRFASSGHGFAYRPVRVNYAGYTVHYAYNNNGKALSQFATGGGMVGQQYHRLESVWITNGSNKIRAYRLHYDLSPEVGSRRLIRVEQYGRDFTRTGAAVNGGSKLPNPYVMKYASDEFGVTMKQYDNHLFTRRVTPLDSSGDGRDELFVKAVSMPDRIVGSSGGNDGDVIYGERVEKRFWAFDSDRNIAMFSPPNALASLFSSARTTNTRTDYSLTTVMRHLPNSNEAHQQVVVGLRRSPIFYEHSDDVGTRYSIKPFKLVSATDVQAPSDWQGGRPVAQGNFDVDPTTELLSVNRVLDFVDDRFVIRGDELDEIVMSLDMDGDGMGEILQSGDKLADPQFTATPSFSTRDLDDPFEGLKRYSNSVYRAVGDVNGDGKDDLLALEINPKSKDYVWVALSTGDAFEPRVVWIDSSSGVPNYRFGGGQFFLADVNNDGMSDLAMREPCSYRSRFFGGCGVKFFLSTGEKFVAPKSAAARGIPQSAGMGDFDGDGAVDFVEAGANGRIHFSNSRQANLLTEVTTPLGGKIKVTYEPSTKVASGSRTPGVRQLVSAIRKENGRGHARTTTFRYADERMDYDLRRSLGYRTITTTLPKIHGESDHPKIVDVYFNKYYAEHGLLRSRTMTVGNTTWSQELYGYAVNKTGNGPYVARRVKSRVKTRSGYVLNEVMKTYEYSVFGELRRVTDHGRSTDGTNVTTADDLTTVTTYFENRGKYIVNKPRARFQQRHQSTTISRSTSLHGEMFYYDGKTTRATPQVGNVTMVREWLGNPNNWGSRVMSTTSYDGWGNPTAVRDALGHGSTFAYDGTKHLFLTRETNAKGHVTRYGTNHDCGKVVQVTDPNNLVTKTAYDAHCREARVDYPDGNLRVWYYNNLGSGRSQHVIVRTRSGSANGSRNYTDTREFFDGFGEIYKTSLSGIDKNAENASVTVMTYDGRGNLATQSVPVSWSEASDNSVPENRKSLFHYDPLGRMTRTTFPDGSYRTTAQQSWPRGQYGWPTMEFHQVETKEVSCYDGKPETPCIRSIEVFDTRGNKLRHYQRDEEGSDVGLSKGWRLTSYEYDLLGRLTLLRDPIGATYRYTYDFGGNRTRAEDPGLGTWTMKYDGRNLLTEQRDAKGQKILFSYDQLGRQTQKRVLRSNGSEESKTTSTYDQVRSGEYNIGHLTTLQRGAHTITYGMHKLGQVHFETHKIDGRSYRLQTSYRHGMPTGMRLPYQPGSHVTRWIGTFDYDAGGRLTKLGDHIKSVTYNLAGQPERTTFGNNSYETRSYNVQRSWLNKIEVRNSAGAIQSSTTYWRNKDGRVNKQHTNQPRGRLKFSYDYAGRLLKSTADHASASSQTFTYDAGGRMRSNSLVGEYLYDSSKAPIHAPWRIRYSNGGYDTAGYDQNGNTTWAYNNKAITYDAENRPLSVSHENGGVTTTYVYGADGKRLKKIVGSGGTVAGTTVYFGNVEIQKWGQGSKEVVIAYPHENLRLVNGNPEYLFTDQLGSVREVHAANGSEIKNVTYDPFGVADERIKSVSAAAETKGFIGERYDADAGLQYLNARYYDPELGSYIPADTGNQKRPTHTPTPTVQ